MGKHFGELFYLRGIITFKLSPFEQRAFAGSISHGLPNFFTRVKSTMFIVAPPFILGYMTYTLTEKKHNQLMRKDPADYENDK